MKATLIVIGTLLTFVAQARDEAAYGNFVGVIQAEWDGPRKMRLLSDFGYFDQTGKHWDAPKGWLIDGASIPKVFWSVIGGPFEGIYRNASVVHDVACDKRDRPWQDVHRMFYNAMRCAGVSEAKAKTMYYAVYHFGPRWNENKVGIPTKGLFESGPSKKDVENIEAWIAKNNPPLSQIEGNRER